MQTVTFYGASDDLIEVNGIEGADEFNVIGEDRSIYVATFEVVAGAEGVLVHALYDGTWSFAPARDFDGDEKQPMPAWPMRVGQSEEVPYSTKLSIEVPDGAAVRLIRTWRGKKESRP